jgi:hypothetical protein
MKITYPEHCGNSPKKILLINIYKAITNYDDSFILNNLSDDYKGFRYNRRRRNHEF